MHQDVKFTVRKTLISNLNLVKCSMKGVNEIITKTVWGLEIQVCVGCHAVLVGKYLPPF